MTQQHPITPPPELVQQWLTEFFGDGAVIAPGELSLEIANRAAQWGADQELESCCEWLEKNVGRWEIPLELRDARRPKPPSLKEQALDVLKDLSNGIETADSWALIQSALEQLDD